MRRGSLMRDVELMARGRKVGYDEYLHYILTMESKWHGYCQLVIQVH